MNKQDEQQLNERYKSILSETANRTVNGNFSKAVHLRKLLQAIWPERDFGFFNDAEYPVAISDRGGAWIGLTEEEWADYESWNDQVALRHGISKGNGVLRSGIHNICWRNIDFGKALRKQNYAADEARAAGTVAAQKSAANMALGRNVVDMNLSGADYTPAKVAPTPIHTDPEALVVREKKLQVSVPEMPKPTKKVVKRGRPKKATSKVVVDKPVESA
jgi:hypothetical protein